MMTLKIYDNLNELINALAIAICDASKEAIALRGQFNFVLSGGNSPKNLYELLASEKYKGQIEWDKTNFFFGDERFVPENDSQRNSLMAQHTLFEHLEISPSQIFKVDTRVSPEVAAKSYAATIEAHFGKNPVEFDFILLGLGDNAHTASLFPNTEILEETEATIKSVFVKEVEMYRITMTAPLINQAKKIAFLVFGKNKSKAVHQVLEDKTSSVSQYPARLIVQSEKDIEWYLDTAAASKL